jgi:hypothetical protein
MDDTPPSRTDGIPYFDVPLNLPHAGTVAERLRRLLPGGASGETAEALEELLRPFRLTGEDPLPDEAARLRDRAAALGRSLVARIERERAGSDRVGQCVRNLFECLELGREGAELSLRAGEDPRSLMRPG